MIQVNDAIRATQAYKANRGSTRKLSDAAIMVLLNFELDIKYQEIDGQYPFEILCLRGEGLLAPASNGKAKLTSKGQALRDDLTMFLGINPDAFKSVSHSLTYYDALVVAEFDENSWRTQFRPALAHRINWDILVKSGYMYRDYQYDSLRGTRHPCYLLTPRGKQLKFFLTRPSPDNTRKVIFRDVGELDREVFHLLRDKKNLTLLDILFLARVENTSSTADWGFKFELTEFCLRNGLIGRCDNTITLSGRGRHLRDALRGEVPFSHQEAFPSRWRSIIDIIAGLILQPSVSKPEPEIEKKPEEATPQLAIFEWTVEKQRYQNDLYWRDPLAFFLNPNAYVDMGPLDMPKYFSAEPCPPPDWWTREREKKLIEMSPMAVPNILEQSLMAPPDRDYVEDSSKYEIVKNIVKGTDGRKYELVYHREKTSKSELVDNIVDRVLKEKKRQEYNRKKKKSWR